MKRETLTNDEKKLLINCLKLHAPELLDKLDELDSGSLDSQIINEMRNAVGGELVDKGFNKNDSPNDYGLQLESLIDTLATLYLWPERNQ